MSDFTPALVTPQPAPATLKIASTDTDAGFIIINASDFDAATMTAYVEPVTEPAKAKAR